MIRKLRNKNVIQPVERRNPDLHGHIYKPLDRRQQGDEYLLPRLCNRQRGDSCVDEDVKAYGDRHFERMHET